MSKPVDIPAEALWSLQRHGTYRQWSAELLRRARPGIFVCGDGWLEELGVRYRIIDIDRDRGVWTGVLDEDPPC